MRIEGIDEAHRALRSTGWALLDAADFRNGESYSVQRVLEIAREFGTMSTRDGNRPIWVVSPQTDDPTATFSIRSGPAELHTDSQYYNDPEDVVALFCVRPAEVGGASTLLPYQAVLTSLRRTSRGASLIKMLHRPSWRFRVPAVFGGGVQASSAPVLDGHRIRWRRDNLDTDCLVPEEIRAADDAYHAFAASLEQITLPLSENQVLLIDNHRTLHGRTAFTDPRRTLLRVRLWRR